MWALDLGAPMTIHAEVDSNYDPQKHADLYPAATKITFEYPAKGDRGPVRLIWRDGSNKIPRTDAMGDHKIPGTGAIVYGDQGAIMHGSHGAGGCRILPDAKANETKQPEQRIPRVKNHHWDWLEAIRTGRPAGSNFDYGGPLTELGLLGANRRAFSDAEAEVGHRGHAIHELQRGQRTSQSGVPRRLDVVRWPARPGGSKYHAGSSDPELIEAQSPSPRTPHSEGSGERDGFTLNFECRRIIQGRRCSRN